MNDLETDQPQGSCEGAAWLSSARAVRCRLKCHNERNLIDSYHQVKRRGLVETAVVRCEEGGDDVKSSTALTSGATQCYNGGYRRQRPRRDADP